MSLVSKRRGILKISKELYDNESMDDLLALLKIKIYHIEYLPFDNSYKILIVSKYLDPISDSVEVPEYRIEVDRGCYFVKV